MSDANTPANMTVWGLRPADPRATVKTESWVQLTVGGPLHASSEGGTARIARIVTPGFERHVAKLFNAEALPRRRTPAAHDKLVFVTRLHAALTAGHQGQVAARPYVVWPEMPLYAEQKAAPEHLLGFAMRAIEGAQPLTTFVTPRHRARFFKHASVDAAFWLAGNIAQHLADLHGRQKPSGILFADLNPRNILIAPDLSAVHFIDADSFQYRLSTVLHGTSESTPGHRSPRMAKADRRSPAPAAVRAGR